VLPRPNVLAAVRGPLFATLVIVPLCLVSAIAGTMPGFDSSKIPSLAPSSREITPAVVNISVRGLVREDTPLYQDPYFPTSSLMQRISIVTSRSTEERSQGS
jgi:hypothetical protein